MVGGRRNAGDGFVGQGHAIIRRGRTECSCSPAAALSLYRGPQSLLDSDPCLMWVHVGIEQRKGVVLVNLWVLDGEGLDGALQPFLVSRNFANLGI